MKDILLELQELLARLQESDPPRRQKWSERQAALNESWEEHRSYLFKALLQSTFAVPEDVLCNRCMVKAAVVKCDMCSSARHLCQGCNKTVHGTRPFHDRNAIVNGHYLPIPVTTSLGSNGEWEIVGN